MGRNYAFLVLLSLLVSLIGSKCEAAVVSRISDSHRSAALELFEPSDEPYESLEEAYKALRTFEILGIEKKADIKDATCQSVLGTFQSSSDVKDLFHALRVSRILSCEFSHEAFAAMASRLKDNISAGNSLHYFYHTVGGLQLIKEQSSKTDVHLEEADGIFRFVKGLSQSDGRWRYDSNNRESSTYAAGMAVETLAGVISLASANIDQSLIHKLKNDIIKLFDATEKYDDGTCFFDEKLDRNGYEGPLAASSSVVRGVAAFVTATSENLNLPADKVHCLAKFFLAVGVPGNAEDLYHQIDALASLESNRFSIPLILSLPATVLSVTSKDQLKVRVNTASGFAAPPLSVKLKQVFTSGSKDASVVDQELEFDSANALYFLETLPNSIDVGKYIFTFEIVLHDPEHKQVYVTGGRIKVPVYVTGVVKFDNAEIAILDSDLGSVESHKKRDLGGQNADALSANHLQKLRLSFHLTTPLGREFKPHQAFLKLRHESNIEHIFVLGNSGEKFEIILDFLGLVEKFYYLSGRYDLQLTVGDSTMENSFFQPLGHVDLDLPNPPEKAPRPPTQAVDPFSRYAPKAEITHIFRVPEKRPPRELSLVFLGVVLLPLVGFLVGLLTLRLNLKNFPTATTPSVFSVLFHLGVGAILLLYLLFWLKLDLFTTLKALGFFGVLLIFIGHRTLSYHASTSAKLKSA